MSLVSLQDIRLAFGGPELFSGVTLQIGQGERICLVGRNGAGKSTLIKIISAETIPDSGNVIQAQDIRIATLPQEVPQDISGKVFDFVSGGLGSIVNLLSEYHVVSNQLSHDTNKGLIQELARIQHEIESSGGWHIQQRVDTVLSRLNLDPEANVTELSGGNKRRVLLAKALVNDPDLLLLDEPTNHLDIDSIAWLEEFLGEFRGSILFITHDRRFLQTLATRIIDLDRGKTTEWPGNYAAYLKNREAELNASATHNALFDKKLAQEEAWIREGIKARRTRNEGRVRALKEMRNKRLERREETGSAKMTLNNAERSGKIVIESKKISYSYDSIPLITDFSTTIMRGDKVGIIGPNGSGKTTLLNILLGSIKPRSGSVRIGANIDVAYFDQHREQLDENASVMENMAAGEHVTINGNSRHIISYLRDFLFPPERARSPVKVLSGGERNRALLAKLFTRPSNVLVLDEPTNDLDTDTLELLEEMLMEYKGTILLVSHDREFLNNIVTSTIACEGKGKIVEYVGGYDDWIRQRSSLIPSEIQKTVKPKRTRQKQEGPRILKFKEKKELEELPAFIESLEEEHENLYTILSDPDVYRQEGNKVVESKKRIEDLELKITAAYDRWEFLETIRKDSV